MADRGVDLSALPKEVRDQLAELDLELSEGRRTASSMHQISRSCCAKAQMILTRRQLQPPAAAAEHRSCCSGSGHEHRKSHFNVHVSCRRCFEVPRASNPAGKHAQVSRLTRFAFQSAALILVIGQSPNRNVGQPCHRGGPENAAAPPVVHEALDIQHAAFIQGFCCQGLTKDGEAGVFFDSPLHCRSLSCNLIDAEQSSGGLK